VKANSAVILNFHTVFPISESADHYAYSPANIDQLIT